jgi:hypothetical protein
MDAIVGAISDVEHACMKGQTVDRAELSRRSANFAKVKLKLKLSAKQGDPVVQQVRDGDPAVVVSAHTHKLR